MNHAYAGAIR